jgi:predicted transcriptional regulator
MKPTIMSFREFIDEMKTVASGKAKAPKRAEKRVFVSEAAHRQFEQRRAQTSLDAINAALRMLGSSNHDLVRLIAEGDFNSMAELAAKSGRAESNLHRTVRKLIDLGLVTMRRGAGRRLKPLLAVRTRRIELDFVAGTAKVLRASRNERDLHPG